MRTLGKFTKTTWTTRTNVPPLDENISSQKHVPIFQSGSLQSLLQIYFIVQSKRHILEFLRKWLGAGLFLGIDLWALGTCNPCCKFIFSSKAKRQMRPVKLRKCLGAGLLFWYRHLGSDASFGLAMGIDLGKSPMAQLGACSPCMPWVCFQSMLIA